MSRNSDEFFEAMLKEEAAEAESDAGNTFAAKMAALESEITSRIDKVEKNLLANLQKEAEAPAPEETETETETETEESNESEDN